ncbi:nucleoside deaminase [Nocardia sp. alder85J]|uniref:nucleoside deaminase n=1 Tax=Nocardia sp. alder85J TaxID=2862949 RepID=UPI001CD5C4AF|nr:nucleoside deaminase [Nocardia sp. alder85J]MCX4092401.1 nucleoside deaminase [Nocardia sp. alder85J]
MTALDDAEQAWLAETVRQANANVHTGGGPFAATVLRAGVVVATGANQVVPNLDPTAHAEVVAIRAACRALGTHSLAGCLLISSCEPCPMCLAAALWSRVDQVVYAADRYDAAEAGFDDLAFYRLFETDGPAWPIRVTHRPIDARRAPFLAWADFADRVEY